MFNNIFYKLDNYKFEKKMANQRKKRKFADVDCWDMKYWMGETFPKMILCLRDMKNGAPRKEFEEFDNLPLDWLIPELSKLEKIKEKEGLDYDIYDIFDKWYIILTRIAFCLQQTNELVEIKNEYEDDLHKELFEDISDCDKKKYYKPIKFNKNDKPMVYEKNIDDLHAEYYPPNIWCNKKLTGNFLNRETEIYNYRQDMKNEAFDLLKKYFENLWD